MQISINTTLQVTSARLTTILNTAIYGACEKWADVTSRIATEPGHPECRSAVFTARASGASMLVTEREIAGGIEAAIHDKHLAQQSKAALLRLVADEGSEVDVELASLIVMAAMVRYPFPLAA